MKNFKLFSESKKKPGKLDIWSFLLPVAFDLVCGVLLIVLGSLALKVTSYALAGLLLIVAVWDIIQYIRSAPMEKITGSRLAVGLALAVSGVLLAFNPDYLKDILPFVWGLALLFGAFLKVQYAFDEKSVGVQKWWVMLIFAAFSLALGILCLLNPAFLGENREMIIGIMLVVESVLDVVVYVLLSKALKQHTDGVAAAAPAKPPVPAAEEPVPAADPVELPVVPTAFEPAPRDADQ